MHSEEPVPEKQEIGVLWIINPCPAPGIFSISSNDCEGLPRCSSTLQGFACQRLPWTFPDLNDLVQVEDVNPFALQVLTRTSTLNRRCLSMSGHEHTNSDIGCLSRALVDL